MVYGNPNTYEYSKIESLLLIILFDYDILDLITFDMQIFNSLLVNGCNLKVGKSIGEGISVCTCHNYFNGNSLPYFSGQGNKRMALNKIMSGL